MMEQWKVILTSEAQTDIRAIYAYISKTLLEPEIAKGQVDRLLKAIHSLDNMPLRFSLYEKEPWHSRGLRRMTVDNYLVFYLPNEKMRETVIFHVFYAGRNVEKLLASTENE